MNTRPSRPSAPGPVAERDWRAQEQALASPGHRADALLAQALRSQPVSQPPAALAATAPLLPPVDAGLERGLLNGLLAILALSTVGALGYFGGQWWSLASQTLGAGAAQWALLGAGCLLLSWLPEAARRLRGPGQASAA